MKTPRAPDGKPTLVAAALLPHAPILVPGIDPDRAAAAARTTAAMRQAARHLVAAGPAHLILLSPHAPWRTGAFGLYRGELRGSLADFGMPEAAIDLPADPEMGQAFERAALVQGLRIWWIDGHPLDHGTVVPLVFLAEAGWRGPTTVIGLTPAPMETLESLGSAIAKAARATRRPAALVASGDMSHRLKPSSPCGHHPRAHEFDEAFIRCLGDDDALALRTIDPDLRELAGEDAFDATLAAITACGPNAHRTILSYEAPFGVGYGVALLK